MEESYHMRYFEGKIPSKDQNGQYIELDAKHLRSSLLDIMKNEVSEMCASGMGDGFQPPHIQVSDNSVLLSAYNTGVVNDYNQMF